MRSLWLLPDREQDGLTRTIEDGQVSSLHEIIELQDFPPAFVLGTPEEVLRAKGEGPFIYGQYARLAAGMAAFCLSAPAGKDISGRIVFWTNLQILTPKELPRIPPTPPDKMALEDKKWLEAMIEGSTDLYQSIRKMLEAVATHPRTTTFSSETLLAAKFKPDWMPRSRTRYNVSKLLIFAVAISTLFSVGFYSLNRSASISSFLGGR